MVSRKKAAGKARKAAKAKARQEAEAEAEAKAEERNQTDSNELEDQPHADQAILEEMLGISLSTSSFERYGSGSGSAATIAPRPRPSVEKADEDEDGTMDKNKNGTVGRCQHGPHPLVSQVGNASYQFVRAFEHAFFEAAASSFSLEQCLKDTTMAMDVDEHDEVWNDASKMKMSMSIFLARGTQEILDGHYGHARRNAIFARYLEEHIAVVFKKTRALGCFPKLKELTLDNHTLVKFFRHRIPCSCLEEEYEEVKSITKMGFCFNPHCKHPGGRVERSNTMYCSRCRCVTYCSRECQTARWSAHKPVCDMNAHVIASRKF